MEFAKRHLSSFYRQVTVVVEKLFVRVEDNYDGKCLVCSRSLQTERDASLTCPRDHFAKLRSLFCSQSCYRRALKDSMKRERLKPDSMTCLLPECSQRCYVDQYGDVKDYCTRTHAKKHDELIAMIWFQADHKAHSPSLKHRSTPMKKSILFYDKHDRYYEFTNFAAFPVVIDTVIYPTTEHYFQSQKLIGTPHCSRIVQLHSAREAFEYPRQSHVKDWVRKDWDSVKDDVMFRGLYHKFTQHDELLTLLVGTQNMVLIEHSPYDSYWGDGPDGKGRNMLGRLLMRLRRILQASLQLQLDMDLGRDSDNVTNRDSDSAAKGESDSTTNRESVSSANQIQVANNITGANTCTGGDEPEIGNDDRPLYYSEQKVGKEEKSTAVSVHVYGENNSPLPNASASSDEPMEH